MQYEYRKLRGRIVEIFGSQGKFAEELKVTENTVSRKLNGSVGFSQDDIILWSKMLKIEKEELGVYFFA